MSQVDGVHKPEGSYSAAKNAYIGRSELPVYSRQPFKQAVLGENAPDPLRAGSTVFEDESIRLWTLADDVLIASFKTKMNTIGPGVIAGLHKAVELAEAAYKGLVIWQPTSLSGGPFSAGADLQSMMPAFMAGGPKAIEPEEKKLQDLMLTLRCAQVPVVAAVSGIALGGGTETSVYCARRVATFESYMGLVEMGVGLIPGGGGLAYLARRAAEQAQGGDILHFLKGYFQAAAMATVGKSALESRALGYLQASDVIVMHSHELLHVAIIQARSMADAGYRPPMPGLQFPVLGRNGVATIQAQLVNLRDGGFISAYDFEIATRIATVLCGGDVEEGAMADEATLMALERKHFCELLGQAKTQERIMGMLQTGKPVRN
ncbi:putative 3-hydroxyacyl-CoA dehydrogenase [mine drainage metagenome]|uniref:Putative 3-hydroxyacyl-CoA dehydrogenase n=1 Tax=mine drainage metagenome TaxID=410659 RepID=A0A1J5PWH3_9ZZZZ